jgi:hypothetical protein
MPLCCPSTTLQVSSYMIHSSFLIQYHFRGPRSKTSADRDNPGAFAGTRHRRSPRFSNKTLDDAYVTGLESITLNDVYNESEEQRQSSRFFTFNLPATQYVVRIYIFHPEVLLPAFFEM